MTTESNTVSDYLVLSRGQWDADASPEDIQRAIDDFYIWHDRLVAEGRMKSGQRLAMPTKLVSRQGVIDGPFTEAKEIVGGYWFFLAFGLQLEVRPVDDERCNALSTTCETPPSVRAART
ncbi:YciI family protein [Hydrogenophaga sp. BPS33]|uniref:YciI family protein n=1 Tax=Hydrogenophaga sp. BPS33 TaxID=2651974 RepID=UPI0013201A16|nr:YciI family protein [Hydrogenophaga sp. BPS33]QHE88143.1 hypothetical protein F9K07_26225 [Hydrogenophaga sp. BPS33]